ncbi:hypothetical protein BDR07DRAFT_1414597 [Suillus spraguei]|nr:hypothetical protein BDR07DRAFT_1414597 [Suillus spraguei]
MSYGMSFQYFLQLPHQDKGPLASMALFIRASAPNRTSIGVTNEVMQIVGGGARIVASACGGAMFSYSMQDGRDAWLAYYFFMRIGFLAIGTCLFLPRDPRCVCINMIQAIRSPTDGPIVFHDFQLSN